MLPCVSLTECFEAPSISSDSHLSQTDLVTASYECDDGKLMNFPELQYPQSVAAACTQDQLFGQLLPFWKIEGIDFPLKDDNKCLQTSHCNKAPPVLSEELHSTWEGGRSIGTKFQYFCNMLEDRNVVEFDTDNQDLTAFGGMDPEIVEKQVEYYMYRTKNSQAWIEMKVQSSSSFYVYFTNSSLELKNNTYCLKFEPDKISLLLFSFPWGELNETVEAEESVTAPANSIHYIWIAIGTSGKLYVGGWDDDHVKSTFLSSELTNLNTLHYIAFSSSSNTSWTVKNGIRLPFDISITDNVWL